MCVCDTLREHFFNQSKVEQSSYYSIILPRLQVPRCVILKVKGSKVFKPFQTSKFFHIRNHIEVFDFVSRKAIKYSHSLHFQLILSRLIVRIVQRDLRLQRNHQQSSQHL